MSRLWVRVMVLTALVLIGIGASLARASLSVVDTLLVGRLESSSIPALLGPINALGRSGWDCAPEKAARTMRRQSAELPDDSGR